RLYQRISGGREARTTGRHAPEDEEQSQHPGHKLSDNKVAASGTQGLPAHDVSLHSMWTGVSNQDDRMFIIGADGNGSVVEVMSHASFGARARSDMARAGSVQALRYTS